MAPTTKEAQRAELHMTIWRIANDFRGNVDGWDFKSYVLGMLFYRLISESLTAYQNEQERKAGDPEFDYTSLANAEAEFGRRETVTENGFYILPSFLVQKVRKHAANEENLNETLQRVFANIEGSAVGFDSEDDLKSLFDDFEVNSLKLGTLAAGGYVWHTMGSGKTRTSFKATQLASRLPSVDKVLFVVDRKDLEYQTMREYDRFEKEAANSNTLTAVLKPHREYYSEYADKVQELLSQFPLGTPIVGEDAQKDFIALFGAILRLQNILTSFEGFVGDQLLTVPQGQDYRNVYLDLYAEFRRVDEEGKERIIDDVVFEIELIKQVAINVDSILMLVQKYCDEHGDGDDKEIRTEITRAIDASPSLRNKKELIEAFVDRISAKGNVDEEWVAFVLARREEEPASIIKSENLRPDATRAFIESAFRDGQIHTTGTAITKVLPPASRFSAEGGHGEKKQRVLGQLSDFFERFFGLSSGGKD